MKIARFLLTQLQGFNKSRISSIDHRQEQLVKAGREQFKKLMDKGLSVPVVLL